VRQGEAVATPSTIAVVIPAYNEARTIRQVAEQVLAQLPQLYVVDDGSNDGTAAALRGLPLTLIRNDTNLGKAGSLVRGMAQALAAGAEAVITLDGDGQHPPAAIPQLIACHRQQPEALVIAARMVNRAHAPKARRIANEVADFWISWAAGRRLTDTQSGFRLYPAALLARVAVRHDRARSFVFESEMLIEAARAGFGNAWVAIESIYPPTARASHFRPVLDISRIVWMVAGKLFARGFYPQGLWRVVRGR